MDLLRPFPLAACACVIIAALSLVSCDWLLGLEGAPQLRSLCEQLDDAPFIKPTSAPLPTTIFETTGTVAALHGTASARSQESGTQHIVKIQQALDVPPWVTDATVYLNGWRLKYLSADHHINALATVVRRIGIDHGQVKWEAIGVITDDNFDDPYTWSYTYTVLMWNAANLNLVVDHQDGTCAPRDHRGNYYMSTNNGTTTALSVFASFIANSLFTPSRTVAILPRGFGFAWNELGDHHLLQLGYDLDHSETFVERKKKYKKQAEDVTPLPNGPSRVGDNFVSWQTYAIFKDNDTRRNYRFGEVVSGLAGNELGVVQPPFAILPREKPSACLEPVPAPQPEEFVVDNIAYRYAIPALTGWELAYECQGDQHVSEIGISIDEIQYDPNTPGTLRYKLSSALRDEDGSPGFIVNHKVTILGLRPAALRTPATGAQPIQRQR